MNNFCTLFDSNYLLRGLAMYASLLQHCPDAHLYIFAFDQPVLEKLQKLNLKSVTVISLKEFESPELLAVKPTRTASEYCWTCGSSTVLYCIEKFNLPACTYLDADLLFFSNPQVLIDEMGKNSVSLSLHRFVPAHDKSYMSGKYCVQFMTFKNDENGMKALRWWRDACIDWCYARLEDGKFGDQKYLDDWTERFLGIHVINNLGAGVAPWNIDRYTLSWGKGKLFATENETSKNFAVVFFHYHHSILYKIGTRVKSGYFQRVEKTSDLLVYSRYNTYLTDAFNLVKTIAPDFTSGLSNDVASYYMIKIREKSPNFIKNIYRKVVKLKIFIKNSP